MNGETVAAVLADGEDFRQYGDPLSKDRGQCSLIVDDKNPVYVSFSHADRLYDPMKEEQSYKFSNPKNMKGLPFPGEGAVGDDSATISAKCAGEGPPYVLIDVALTTDVYDEGSKQRQALRKFAVQFTSGYKDKLECSA